MNAKKGDKNHGNQDWTLKWSGWQELPQSIPCYRVCTLPGNFISRDLFPPTHDRRTVESTIRMKVVFECFLLRVVGYSDE